MTDGIDPGDDGSDACERADEVRRSVFGRKYNPAAVHQYEEDDESEKGSVKKHFPSADAFGTGEFDG